MIEWDLEEYTESVGTSDLWPWAGGRLGTGHWALGTRDLDDSGKDTPFLYARRSQPASQPASPPGANGPPERRGHLESLAGRLPSSSKGPLSSSCLILTAFWRIATRAFFIMSRSAPRRRSSFVSHPRAYVFTACHNRILTGQRRKHCG